MYRNCIFCSADLGSNDSLERFHVGRSLAFDAAKGRLWAVCPKCARWNLAPLEERWEAIEDAERLFRDTRTRVQRENIGLARLRDGTRLVRIGEALAGELAVWRYGAGLVRRRRLYLASGVGFAAAVGVITFGAMGAGIAINGALVWQAGSYVRGRLRAGRPIARLSPEETGNGLPAVIGWESAAGARLSQDRDGNLQLSLPKAQTVPSHIGRGIYNTETRPLMLHGEPARRVLTRAMVVANAAGASHALVEQAVDVLAQEPSPAEYVRRAAGERLRLEPDKNTRARKLALEMALHEETERRALEGELSMLEAMWREAEQIAAIADRLPDHLPPANPPRV